MYVGGDLNVTGVIAGVIAGTVSTASQINTIQNPTTGPFFLTFVDSNNATAIPETVYTSATIKFSPTIGLGIGGTGTPTATLDVTGSVRISGISTVSNTTNATSTATGALIVAGGAGIGQNLYVGGGVQVTGLTTVTNTTNATSTSSGALFIAGGVGIGGDLYASRIRTVSTTNATSTTTGEIIVQGGVGIGQNLYVGGLIVGTIAATVSTASQLTTVQQPIPSTYYLTFVDSNNSTAGSETFYTSSTIYFSPASGMTITNATAASSTQTGALTVAGGVGIGQNLYVGGQENNSNL
ncbi:MAG: hypothetical protein EBU90_28745, partial [Proteobacteria bacterium]|nr:hypothetical protein [Pseudomonadota bacterium]